MKAHRDDNNVTRIAVLETLVAQTQATLVRLEQKMDDGFKSIKREMHDDFINIRTEMHDSFSRTDKKFDKLEIKTDYGFIELRKELGELRKENSNQFRIVVFTLLTLIGTPLMVQGIQFLNHLITG